MTVAVAEQISAPAMTEEQKLKTLMKHCQSYKGAVVWKSLYQLITTSVMYFALVAGMQYAYAHQAYWFVALGMLPAAGLLVRLFIFQHDCGHSSFFNQSWANDLVGRMISILTFTPYTFWKKAHNLHHATSGNLSKRSAGAIDTITVREYQALSAKEKFKYRLFRNPLIVLLIGAPLNVFVIQRFFPIQNVSYIRDYHPLPTAQGWKSVMLTNAALLLVYGAFVYFLGWGALFFAYLPIVLITAWGGGWLFYVQHQYENTYWQPEDKWNYYAAALYGSSYYVLPKVLQWFTGNIGLHHIHHFSALIPNYKLQACLDANPELEKVNRLTIRQSLDCVRYALWDEAKGKMVSFKDMGAAA